MNTRFAVLLTTIFFGIAVWSPAETPRHSPVTKQGAFANRLVESDGRPIVGAKVYAARYMNKQRWVLHAVVSDRAGEFRLAPETAPFVDLVIILPPASPRDPRGAPLFARVSKSGPTRITRSVGVPLRARFLDGDGKPLVGREVMAFPAEPAASSEPDLPAESTAFVSSTDFPYVPPELKAALTARTDATGTARFSALPQGTRVSLAIDTAPEKRRPLALAGNVLLTPEPLPSVTLRLPLDGVITGRVLLKQSGKPLMGARVFLEEPGFQGGLRPFGPQADAQGRFRFTGLYPATYKVVFEGMNGELGGDQYQQEGLVQVTLTERRDEKGNRVFLAQHDISMRKSAHVAVTVRDMQGRPLFGQTVMLEGKDGGGGSYTNLQGKATLTGLPGVYHIAWKQPGTKGSVDARELITLAEGERRTVMLGGKAGHDDLHALAPSFLGQDREGKSVRLSRYRGQVVVLDFVTLDEETSHLDALRKAESVARRLHDSRLHFVAICSSFREDRQKPGWLARKVAPLQAQFPHVRFLQDAPGGPKEPAPSVGYHVDGWPQRFVIGPDGTLRNAYGSSDYGGESGDYAGINDAARLLRDIQYALKK